MSCRAYKAVFGLREWIPLMIGFIKFANVLTAVLYNITSCMLCVYLLVMMAFTSFITWMFQVLYRQSTWHSSSSSTMVGSTYCCTSLLFFWNVDCLYHNAKLFFNASPLVAKPPMFFFRSRFTNWPPARVTACICPSCWCGRGALKNIAKSVVTPTSEFYGSSGFEPTVVGENSLHCCCVLVLRKCEIMQNRYSYE